jgi:hypothetical protein
VQQTARKPYENHEEKKTKKQKTKKQKRKWAMAAAKLSRQNSKFSQLRLSSSPSLSLSRSRARQWARSLVAMFPCLREFSFVPLLLSSPCLQTFPIAFFYKTF